MKKIIFYIISVLCVTSFAQEDGNPAVELPDFVITGKDVVMVRRVEKIPAELISVISDDYTKPLIKPEKLEVAGITNPVSWDKIDFDSTKFYRGYISVESGRYKLPASQINYTFPFERGMINGRINQLNQLAYVNNSERQSIFGALVFNYSLPIDGKFLPGTKFSLGGKHDKNIFKFFGSDMPGLERNLNIGTVNLGIQNLYMNQFIFDINFDGDFTYLEDDNFTEALYSTYAFGRFQAENFGLNLKADFKNQSLKTDSLFDLTSNYYFLRPSVSLELFDKIKTDVGFTFSKSGENNFNALFASLGLELTKNVVLLAEYSPQSEFITAGKLMRGNYYFTQQNLENFFLKKKNKIRASVKYEYDKYYQIDGGVEYYKAENLPYYFNLNQSGFFNAASTNATNLNLFVNLIYHLGPYGILYASFDYFNIEDDESRKIPYYPNLKISANYGYDFNNSIRTDLSVHYLSDRYADLDNKTKLNGFFTLDFKFSYKLKEQFLLTLKVENILNTKPFNWQGYREKPLDASIGFNFLFD